MSFLFVIETCAASRAAAAGPRRSTFHLQTSRRDLKSRWGFAPPPPPGPVLAPFTKDHFTIYLHEELLEYTPCRKWLRTRMVIR